MNLYFVCFDMDTIDSSIYTLATDAVYDLMADIDPSDEPLCMHDLLLMDVQLREASEGEFVAMVRRAVAFMEHGED